MKRVPHGHTNLGKGTKVEAQADEQVREEKKTMVRRDHTRKPNWLWHYLGNPYFFVIDDSNNSPIVAKPVQILSS